MRRALPSSTALELSGDGLTLEDARRILRGDVDRVVLAPSARRRVQQARHCLDNLIAAGAIIYGVNTGFGKLCNQRIEPDEVLALQENLLHSHAVGMAALLNSCISRLALTLRSQAFRKTYRGVTSEPSNQCVAEYSRGELAAMLELRC